MQNTGKNSVDLVLVHPPLVYNDSDYPIFPVSYGEADPLVSISQVHGRTGKRGKKGVEAVISFIENYYKKVRDLRNFSLQY